MMTDLPITVTNIYQSFTYKMAAKINWHRYGTKLHCHPMYNGRKTVVVVVTLVCLLRQVLVRARSRDEPLSHEFGVILDADFERFMSLVDRRLDVVARISRAVADPRPTHVRVTRVAPGSVVVSWTNSSLIQRSDCPIQVRHGAVRKVATPLRELTCHMGSHSVTVLPATRQR